MPNAFFSNIRVLAKSSTQKTASKEPFFDKKWGSQSAMNKAVDRSNYHLETENDATAQIHDQILVLLKTKKPVDDDRKSFLSKLTQDSMEFINEQKGRLATKKHEEDLCQNSMSVMTEHIFEILKSYSYELNNAIGYGYLHVAATNPQTVTEVIKYNSLRQPEETITYYRARLSTTLYSLVLRGDRRGIQFFIIPVSRAIGLSKQESHFLPVTSLYASLDKGNVVWKTEDGRSLIPSKVEKICMHLFQQLIEETKAHVLRLENKTREKNEVSTA